MLNGKSGVSLIESIDTEKHTVKIAGVLDDYSDNKQGININMINGTRK